MKDINKSDILEVIEDLSKTLKREKQTAANIMLPGIQNYIYGMSSVIATTKDDRLEFEVTIRRTKEYKKDLRQKEAHK